MPQLSQIVEAAKAAKAGATQPLMAALSATMTQTLAHAHRQVNEVQYNLGLAAAGMPKKKKHGGGHGAKKKTSA